MKRPLMVGIAGGSGSGKSWLATRLTQALRPNVVRVCLDDFYLDRSHLTAARRARVNFDHPRAIDWKSLLRVVKRLRSGKSGSSPCYDFSTHCRLPKAKTVAPRPVVLVEGLWAFHNPPLRRLFDLRIFIECDTKRRLARRLARDLATRGRTEGSIRRQFQETVEPMHDRYVAPQQRWADIVLRNQWGTAEIAQIAAVILWLGARPAESRRS